MSPSRTAVILADIQIRLIPNRDAGLDFKQPTILFDFSAGTAVDCTQDRNIDFIELLEPIHGKEDVHCVTQDNRWIRLLEDLSESIACWSQTWVLSAEIIPPSQKRNEERGTKAYPLPAPPSRSSGMHPNTGCTYS